METKNFLFVSMDGLITDIAWQVSKEGHNVKYYIDCKEEREIGNGLIPKTDDWEKEIDWADIIIFDDVISHSGNKAKLLRESGKLVIGGTPYTDKLESETEFGQAELKKAGISVVQSHIFTFEEAIAFVSQNPARYFIKPIGGYLDMKDVLFVGEEEDGKDVIQVLNDYQKAWSDKVPKIELQKRITGVEVAVGAFFNGKKFIYPINVNFEHTRWFPGNLGPSTAEMGTTMFWSQPNIIFNKTLKKFEPKLAEEGYIGYIDLKCVVNNYGIYPIDWTARFGYPTISVQHESMITPIGEFFYNLAKGEDIKLKVKSGFHIGIRLVVPPFPFDDPETFNVKSKDTVVYFPKTKRAEDVQGIHIEDIKVVNGEWLITGTTGTVLIVCASASTLKQAQAIAYNRIKNINIPHMYYRDDIGDSWFEDSDKLHTWGYLRTE